MVTLATRHRFSGGRKPEEKQNLRDMDIDGNVILKRLLKKWCVIWFQLAPERAIVWF